MPRGSSLEKMEEWTERLNRFGKSGQTVAQFCQAEDVSQPSYYYWRKKLADRAKSALHPNATGHAFRAVEVSPPCTPPSPSGTTIRLVDGIEIELGSDLRVVESIVKQLLPWPAGASSTERS